MPTYVYRCDCGHAYEEFRSITAPEPSQCPKCQEPLGEGFNQDFRQSSSLAIVYGNPTTIGQQAEINARRVGKERLQQMALEDKSRTSEWTGPLPEGATINTTGTGKTPPWRDGSMGTAPLAKPLDIKKVANVEKYVQTGEI
jgi:putative FmdB family regulatory protein